MTRSKINCFLLLFISCFSLIGIGEAGWGMWQHQLNDLDLGEKSSIWAYHKAGNHQGYYSDNISYYESQILNQLPSIIPHCPICRSQIKTMLDAHDTRERVETLEHNFKENQQNHFTVAKQVSELECSSQLTLHSQKILEDRVKNTQNRTDSLEYQLEAQRKEIEKLLFTNKTIQSRVQKLEKHEQKECEWKEYKRKMVRKMLGYGGTAVAIGLLSWYGYNVI